MKAFKETNPAEVNKVISKKKSPTGSGGKHKFISPKLMISQRNLENTAATNMCLINHVFDKPCVQPVASSVMHVGYQITKLKCVNKKLRKARCKGS